MQPVAIRLRASPVESLLVTFYTRRRRILAMAFTVFALAIAVALLIKPPYPVQAQVLVTLGSEYAYRPSAGESSGVNLSLEHENAMKTESEILGSADLHRETLRRVGVMRLYPDYFAPPGVVARLTAAVKDEIAGLATLAGLPPAERKPDPEPIELALDEFEAAMFIDLPKTGSTITITLRHKDAALGTEALNTMLALYLERRHALFEDRQSEALARQVEATYARLQTSDGRLEAFKLAHRIGSSDPLHTLGGFDSQREILLHRKGEAESDRADALNQMSQFGARLAVLREQMQTLPADVTIGHDTDSEIRVTAIRQSLDQLRSRYAEVLSTLRADSPAAQVVETQLRLRQADYDRARHDNSATTTRVAQNPTWLLAQADLMKTEADSEGFRARMTQDDANIAVLIGQIRALDENARELEDLQRARAIDDDAYRSAVKLLDDRRSTEDVDAHCRPSAAILQPAVAPLNPAPVRKIVGIVGVVLSVFTIIGATLVMHGLGSRYWQAQTIEHDLGLAVLAEVMLVKGGRLTEQLVLPRRLGRASDRLAGDVV